MTETKVAKRYAKSLLDLAQSQELGIDAINNDMKLIANVCEANRELSLLLKNPIVHADKKLKILKSIFESKVNKITISFIDIITRKRRENYLEAIVKEFTELYKEYKGIQTAVITTAVGLDDNLRKEVLKLIKSNTKSEIELIENQNKDLIGGFVLRMGDVQYDASVVRSLRKLTREFSVNPYVKKN